MSSKPILRAGPFASSSDYFLEEPDSFDFPFDIVPVNCAKGQRAFWPWKAVTAKFSEFPFFVFESNISWGGVDLSEDITAPEGGTMCLTALFAYQATQPWSFNGSGYGVSVVSTTGQSLEVYVNDSLVYIDEVFDADFENSNFDSVVFPASITPSFVEIVLRVTEPPPGETQVGTLKIPI